MGEQEHDNVTTDDTSQDTWNYHEQMVVYMQL